MTAANGLSALKMLTCGVDIAALLFLHGVFQYLEALWQSWDRQVSAASTHTACASHHCLQPSSLRGENGARGIPCFVSLIIWKISTGAVQPWALRRRAARWGAPAAACAGTGIASPSTGTGEAEEFQFAPDAIFSSQRCLI